MEVEKMKNFILWKVFLQNYSKKSLSFSTNNSGYTLIEALTSVMIGGIVLGASLGGFLSIKELMFGDRVKTDINQRLRTVFSTIGPDIQQTGEGLISNPNLPAVVVAQQTLPGPITTSEISIRKADLIGSLTLCTDLTNGTTNPVNVIDDPATPPTPAPPPGCEVTDSDNNGWPDNIEIWQGKKTENGGTIKAFIFDSTTGNYEFFDYINEQTRLAGSTMTPSAGNTPDEVNLTTNSHIWQNTYLAGSSVIYLLEERKYEVNNNTLQLVVNGTDTFNLIESIENIDITVYLQESLGADIYACKIIPPTVASDCPPDPANPGAPAYIPSNYTWAQIKSVKVDVVAQPSSSAPVNATNNLSSDDLTLSQEFFPRNRLSF